MEAESLLSSLCERHGVDLSEGERLLPLVRWALKGPRESREKILQVVEASLQRGAAERSTDSAELVAAADQAVLMAVARVLHTWIPQANLLNLGLGRAGEDESLNEDESPAA